MTGHDWFAEKVPYRFRDTHRWFANMMGYFWIPCPMCGEPFGGHEWRDIDGQPSSIPAPDGRPDIRVGICPECTQAGRGVLTYP
jgi:hypothetical protein